MIKGILGGKTIAHRALALERAHSDKGAFGVQCSLEGIALGLLG